MDFFISIKSLIGRKALCIATFIAVGLLLIPNYNSTSISHAESEQFLEAPKSFSNLAEMVSPSVVNIRTVKTIKGGGHVFRHFREPFGQDDRFRDFFDRFFGGEQHRDFKQRSLGSGFVIDKDGYIVTNNHVVENADKIEVILKNEMEFDAEIVGRDPNTDLALIKIESKEPLPVAKLGNSDELKIGQWVVAIGSPFGLVHTVTAGIVSAKGRVIGSGPYDDFIQTDASINPGNSGGPLINMKGEVIGINTAIVASGQGIGFAIPVNLAKGIIDQLLSSGEVTRGWLGVGIQSMSPELSEYYGIKNGKGVLVTEVFPGDPADKAGMQPKDIIFEVNGKRVESSRDLTRMIADIGVGDIAKIKVLRDGIEKTFRVKIARRDDDELYARDTTKQSAGELGIRVTQITPEIAGRFNIEEAEGVIVIAIVPDSKAEKGGLMVGDIVKEINHKEIKTMHDFEVTVRNIKKGESINLFIRRMNMGFLVIKLTK
jgi:serine protease Do